MKAAVQTGLLQFPELMMAEKYQIFHNAIFNTASWIFTIVLGFVFLPYIVQKMGTDGYGVLVLVLSVIGYFAVLDLNLGDAVIKYVAEYHAENNMKKVNEVVSSVILLYLVLGIVGGLSILLLSGTIVSRLLKIKSDLQPAALFAFNLGSVGILLTMMLSALSAIPNGVNRYDITSKATMVMGLITTVVTVFLLYLGQGLKEIVVLNLVVTLLGIMFYAVTSKKLLPGLVLSPSLSFSGIRKVLKYGLFSMMSRLSGIMQFQGVRLLAGAVLGVSSVTYYVIPFNLVSKAMAITFRLGAVIFPVISGMQGKRDFESVVGLYLKSSRLIFSISTAICLPLFLFGDRFLGLWMGQQFKQHTGVVMLLLTLSLYLDACTNVPSNVLNGLGMPKICGYFSILNAVINLALVYPLSKGLNINGIALSFLLGQILVAPAFVIYVNNKVLKLSLIKLLREAYLLPAVAGLVTALILMICVRVEIHRMVSLLGIMMATTALYIVICNLIGVFSKEEKDHIIGYLHISRKNTANHVV
jgi:O-antigen/teichoic acid export membrane protein